MVFTSDGKVEEGFGPGNLWVTVGKRPPPQQIVTALCSLLDAIQEGET